MFSAATLIHYEPVGRFYEAAVKRLRSDKSTSLDEDGEENEKEKTEKDEEPKELSFDEKQYLLTLDSSEWKVCFKGGLHTPFSSADTKIDVITTPVDS